MILKPSICDVCGAALMSRNGQRKRCGERHDKFSCAAKYHSTVMREKQRRKGKHVYRTTICIEPDCSVEISSPSGIKKRCGDRHSGCTEKNILRRREAKKALTAALKKEEKDYWKADRTKVKMKNKYRRKPMTQEQRTIARNLCGVNW